MTLLIILGNLVGGLGLLLSLYALKQQDMSLLKRYTAYCSALLALSYYLLGGYTATIIILIICARQLLGSISEKFSKNVLLSLCIFFVIAAIVCTYYTWENYMSLLPSIATIISTVAYFYANQKVLRIILIVSNVLWLFYAFHIYSLFHVFGCIMGIVVGYQEFKKLELTKEL